MRILAISHMFPRVGEERNGIFVSRQLSAMYKQGADITVLVPLVWCPKPLRNFRRWKNYDHTRKLCKFEGIETVTSPYVRPPGNWYNRWSGLAAYLATKKKAERLHRLHKFEIIYATDFFPDGDAAVRLGRDLHIPTACLSIGVDVNITAHSSKTIHRRFTTVAKALDGILACGQSVADKLKAVTGTSPLCVYGVLDLNKFTPVVDKSRLRKELQLPPERIMALYAGYLQKRKGIYEMLEAFSKIQKIKPDTLLCVCGSGEEELPFKEIVRQKNMSQIVRLIGEVHPDDMHKWMQASDLFVLASHTEGMPNVVMEAMACGLPVVTTTVGGLPEAVGDCEGAILVPPKNIDAFTDAVLTVLQNEQMRHKMSLAARRRAEERFSVEQNASRILSFLSEVVKRSRKSTK